MGKNLQAALERTSRGGAPVVPITAAPPSPPPAEERAAAAARSPKTAGRGGRTHIGAYLAPDFKKSLMLVRAQTGEDVQTLIAKALNDLFRAHNVPVVDNN
jgi:hypothetical protein